MIGFFMQLGNNAEQINASHDLAIDAERLVTELSEAQRHAEALVTTGNPVRADQALAMLTLADGKLEDLRVATPDDQIDVRQQFGADRRIYRGFPPPDPQF